MLELTGASGLTLVGGLCTATAQSAKRIEQLDPKLDGILDKSQPIQEIATGFGGELGPAEGPVWIKEGKYLLFSDIHANKRRKYTPGQAGVTVFKEPTNRANGLTRDLQGRLLACEHDSRRVTRQEADGSITVIANSFQGKRLNRPNDVVVKSDGSIYFTDPGANILPDQWDLTFGGVYRVSADLGSMTLLIDHFVQPNGLCFTPDESQLYVNDTTRAHIRVFDVGSDHALSNGRVFAEAIGDGDLAKGELVDGMKLDERGNVYVTGPKGVWIFAPDGEHLGVIEVPENVGNLNWGGDDWRTLFIPASTSVYSVRMKVGGNKLGYMN